MSSSSSLWAWLLGCLGLRKQRRQRRARVTTLTPDGNPLPRVVHRVLQPADLAPGRVIIVGDVHGCYNELVELLNKVAYEPRTDNLILVGDLVNKGPKSQAVVAAARSWCATANCWVVQGNHDGAALAAARHLAEGGSAADLDPKFDWVDQLLPEDREFLMQLPFSLTLEGYNVLVVHAGLVPGLPLQQQDLAALTKMRDVVAGPDGSLIAVEKPQEDSQAWAPLWTGPRHVLFGHDASRRLQTEEFATGLDTGCVYGGQLTAAVLPPLSHLTTASGGGSSSVGDDTSVSAAALGRHALPAAPTLKELGAQLHSLTSNTMCDKAVEKAAKKAAKKAVKQQQKKKQHAHVTVKSE